MEANLSQRTSRSLILIARVISRVFGPFTIVPAISIYFLIEHTGLSTGSKLPILIVLVLSTLLVPGVYLFTLYRCGVISDLDMTDRKERLTPFLIVLVVEWLGALLTQLFNPTRLFTVLIALTIAVLTIMVFVTIKEKVSLHASGVTVLFFVINLSMEWRCLWVVLLIPLVSWARWYLRKHTIQQLVLGIVIPVAVFLTGFTRVLE